MSERAHYILKENGQVSILYDRHGGMAVAYFGLDGPEAIYRVVTSYGDPHDGLMPSYECEAFIFMDVEQRTILIDSVHYCSPVPLCRTYLALVRNKCPGWTVNWAHNGLHAAAEILGCRCPDMEMEFFEHKVSEVQVRDDPPCPERIECLVSVRYTPDRVADYAFGLETDSLLGIGPSLLNVLSGRQEYPLPTEGEAWDKGPQTGLVLDVPRRRMWVWDPSGGDPGTISVIADRWPGWDIRLQHEGVILHAVLTGRDASPLKMPDDAALALLNQVMEINQPMPPAGLPSVEEIARPYTSD